MKKLGSNEFKISLVIVFVLFIVAFSIMNSKSGNLSKIDTVPKDNLTASVANIPTQGLISHYTMNNSGTTLQDDHGNNNGIINGATVVAGKEGNGLDFDGVNDYVSIPNPGISFSEGTISLWASIDTTSKEQALIYTGYGWGANEYLGIVNLTNGVMRIDADDGAVPNGCDRKSFSSPAGVSYRDSNWHYITLSYKALNTAKLYIDGVLIGSVSLSNSTCDPSIDPSLGWTIGYQGAPNTYLKGKIDEISIYNRALSSSEVLELYNIYMGSNTGPTCHSVSSLSDCQANGMCDADDNGVINLADRQTLNEFIAGLQPTCGASKPNNCFCDLNANGKINTQDILFFDTDILNSPEQYLLSVNYGTGSGTYSLNEIVNITANAPATGKQFKEWTGTGVNHLANRYLANTTVNMPASNIDLTATYENIQVAYCGDNIINNGEVCDGTNLNGQSCTSLGFSSGTLSCASDCGSYITNNCVNTGGSSFTVPPYNYQLNTYSSIVYIDPENINDPNENGSIAHPYNSWLDLPNSGTNINLSSNTAYLQKRGTNVDLPKQLLVLRKNKVLIGAYGTGDRPHLRYTLSVSGTGTNAPLNINGSQNVVAVDLEISSITNPSGIFFVTGTSGYESTNITLYNSHLYGTLNDNGSSNAWNIIRIMTSSGISSNNIKLIGNELHNANDDTMIAFYTNGLEVAYNNIYNANLRWFLWVPGTFGLQYCPEGNPNEIYPFACGGDIIQLDEVDDAHIHHNKLDHSSTGNKFVIITRILNSGQTNDNLLIEYNEIIGPSTLGQGNTGLGLYEFGGDTIVRYNRFIPPYTVGLYTKTTTNNIQVYGNIFQGGTDHNVFLQHWGPSQVHNNIFFNIPVGKSAIKTESSPIQIKNNIFMNEVGRDIFSRYSNTVYMFSNNLYLNQHNDPSITGEQFAYFGNPNFVDFNGGDFHLQSNSPAINAGTMNGLPAGYLDIDGQTVPQGNAPDIGIYEYTVPPLTKILNFFKNILA